MKKFFTQTILLVIALLAGTSAKAVSYKIDGPETLTTFATYKIVTEMEILVSIGVLTDIIKGIFLSDWLYKYYY